MGVQPSVRQIGKYVVLDVLGAGGMGIVYKASDPAIGRTVAIKMLKRSAAENPDGLLERFFSREMRSTASLNHKNIVTVYDSGDVDGNPYLVMEYLEGEPTSKIIADRQPLTLVEKLDIVIQVCEGLQYAHDRDIIHRDIKPANVIRLVDGNCKIVDFGVSRIAGSETSLVQTGQLVGSLSYMSPEQINSLPLDGRSDIFAAGVMLYELVTNVLPFKAADPASTFVRILREEPAPLSRFAKDLPASLQGVVNKALAKKAADRYQSAEEFGFDLLQVQKELKDVAIAESLKRAEGAVQRGDLERARVHLQEIIKLDRQHERANRMLRDVRKAIQQQQRASQVIQMRSQAQVALAGLQYEEALACADQALRLDPNDPESTQLCNEIRTAITRAKAVREALNRAETATFAGDFDEAKEAVEESLRLAPTDSEARALALLVNKELAERSRRLQVQEFVDSARRGIAERKFHDAIDALHRAEQLDPSDSNVRELLQWAQRGQEQEKRRRDLEEITEQIDKALHAGDFTSACTISDVGLTRFPDEPTLLRLKAISEKQREIAERRSFVHDQSLAVKVLSDQGNLTGAVEALTAALRRYPGEPNLESLMALTRAEIERLGRLREESLRLEAIQRAEAEAKAARRQQILTWAVDLRSKLDARGELDGIIASSLPLRKAVNANEIEDEHAKEVANLVLQEVDARIQAREQAHGELEQVRHFIHDPQNIPAMAEAETRLVSIKTAHPHEAAIQSRAEDLFRELRELSQHRDQVIQRLTSTTREVEQTATSKLPALLENARGTAGKFSADPRVGALLQQIESGITRRLQLREERLRDLKGLSSDFASIPSLADLSRIRERGRAIVALDPTDDELSHRYQEFEKNLGQRHTELTGVLEEVQSLAKQVAAAGSTAEAVTLAARAAEIGEKHRGFGDLQEVVKRAGAEAQGRRMEHDLILEELQSLRSSIPTLASEDELTAVHTRANECRTQHAGDPEITGQCDVVDREAEAAMRAMQEKAAAARAREQEVAKQMSAARAAADAGDLQSSLKILKEAQKRYPERPELFNAGESVEKQIRREEQLRLEREQAEKARLEKLRLEQEQAEKARLEQLRLDQERVAREKAEQLRLEQERAEKARLEKIRLEQEAVENARLEKLRLEKERVEREKAEQLRLEQERAEKARLEKIRLEKEAAEKARLEKLRLEKEKADQEKAEQLRLEQERAEKARLEKIRLEQVQAEKARLEKLRLEQERAEREKAEQLRLEQERAEKARLEKIRLEQEAAEKARLEQLRLEQQRLAEEKAEQERQRRAAGIKEHGDAAQALLEGAQIHEAASLLAGAVHEFPESEQLRGLLQTAQQRIEEENRARLEAEAKQRALDEFRTASLQRAQTALRNNDHTQAISVLQEALGRVDSPDLRQLLQKAETDQAEYQHMQLMRVTSEEVAEMLRGPQYRESVGFLDEKLARSPHSDLRALRDQAVQVIAQRDAEAAALLSQMKSALERKDPLAAQKLAENAPFYCKMVPDFRPLAATAKQGSQRLAAALGIFDQAMRALASAATVRDVLNPRSLLASVDEEAKRSPEGIAQQKAWEQKFPSRLNEVALATLKETERRIAGGTENDLAAAKTALEDNDLRAATDVLRSSPDGDALVQRISSVSQQLRVATEAAAARAAAKARRDGDLRELTSLQASLQQQNATQDLSKVSERVDAIAKAYPGDKDIAKAAKALQKTLQQQKKRAASAAKLTTPQQASVVGTKATQTASTPAQNNRRPLMIGAVALIVIACVIGLFTLLKGHQPATPANPPATAEAPSTPTPPVAPTTPNVSPSAGSTLAGSLDIEADLPGTTALVDGQPRGDFSSHHLNLAGLAPGSHTLNLTAGRKDLSLQLNIDNRGAMDIKGAHGMDDQMVVALLHGAAQPQLFCRCNGAEIRVDGRSVRPAGRDRYQIANGGKVPAVINLARGGNKKQISLAQADPNQSVIFIENLTPQSAEEKQAAAAATKADQAANHPPTPPNPPASPTPVATPPPQVNPPAAAKAADPAATAWANLQNSNDVGALRSFHDAYPNSPQAKLASDRMEAISWENAQKSTQPADLERFLRDYPKGTHAQEAKDKLTALNNNLAESSRQQKVQQDRNEITQVLTTYKAGYEAKDVNRLASAWPGAPRQRLLDTFKVAGKIRMQLDAGPPEITGDTATVRCTQKLEIESQGSTSSNKTQIVFTLKRDGGKWVIDNLK